tara:strand:+ start:1145 stop:1666 length:522 start_codon:yes stop_codon:yes gene_type:complete
MILGLDLSTSIIGICVVDDAGNICLQEYIDLRKEKTFFDKVNVSRDKILDIIKQNNIRDVWIEQSLQAFRPGFSSAKTLLTLSKFGGIMEWIIFEGAGITPQYVGATSARKMCGITVPRGAKAKSVVMHFLLDKEPAFVVEYTKHGNIKKHFYDIADAIVVAKAGLVCQLKKN